MLFFHLLIALGHAAGGTIIIARQASENDLAGDAAAIASSFIQLLVDGRRHQRGAACDHTILQDDIAQAQHPHGAEIIVVNE